MKAATEALSPSPTAQTTANEATSAPIMLLMTSVILILSGIGKSLFNMEILK
jgi:hypothetical protein